MDDLRHLYQATILDHNKKPRNFREIFDAEHQADGYNPICGDKLRVFVELDGDRVKDVAFQGVGCAISVASASLMTDAIKGCSIEEVESQFENFHDLLTGSAEKPVDRSRLGKLAVFSGVREFPLRGKCATLAGHTLRAALGDSNAGARTE